MRANVSLDAEMLEDLRSTQQIIPVIRWFLLGTAMFITNYRAEDLGTTQLAINNVAIWGLTLYNAFLHARAFIGRPLGMYPVLFASVLDIVVISALIAISDKPFGNNFFIFYYAAVFGVGMVFPPTYTIVFAGITALVYALISILIGPGILVSDGQEKVLITRLIVMFAIGAGGSFFWVIERSRRAASVQAQLDILQSGLSLDAGQVSEPPTASG